MFQRFGNMGRRFNIRGLSMITRGLNSFKNIKLLENIKKNHQKKKTEKKDNKTQRKIIKKNQIRVLLYSAYQYGILFFSLLKILYVYKLYIILYFIISFLIIK